MGKEDNESHVNPVIKYVLFFFNLLFWLIGASLIGLGAWAYTEKNKFFHNDAKDVYDVIFDFTLIIMAVGVVIFVVAFTGCIGALRENICLLRTFYIILALIFFLLCVGAMLGFIFAEDIKDLVAGIITDEGISRYREDPDLQDLINWFQETFECCGVGDDGYLEWNQNRYFNCTVGNPSPEACAVPFSCCKGASVVDDQYRDIQCGFGVQKLQVAEAEKIIYTSGCLEQVLTAAQDKMVIIGGVVVAFALPQLAAIFLARILINQIQNTLDAYA